MKIEQKCDRCGKTFVRERAHSNRGMHTFCSLMCCAFFNNNLRRNDRQDRFCYYCGKKIVGSGIKFCSRSCAAKVNNRKYPKRIKQTKAVKPCVLCGKPIKRGRKGFCSWPCYREFLRRKTVSAWLDGKISGNNCWGGVLRPIKAYLIKKLGEKCQRCGWNERNERTGKVPIQVEHIDGNWKNTVEGNLTLLCPNCHSLTSTYGALNKGNGRNVRRLRYRDGKSF